MKQKSDEDSSERKIKLKTNTYCTQDTYEQEQCINECVTLWKSECDHRIYGIVIRVLMNYGQRISEFVRYRKNKCNLRIYDVAFSKIRSQSS
jgi:hypothetical protein